VRIGNVDAVDDLRPAGAQRITGLAAHADDGFAACPQLLRQRQANAAVGAGDQVGGHGNSLQNVGSAILDLPSRGRAFIRG